MATFTSWRNDREQGYGGSLFITDNELKLSTPQMMDAIRAQVIQGVAAKIIERLGPRIEAAMSSILGDD